MMRNVCCMHDDGSLHHQQYDEHDCWHHEDGFD
jgi:hypothetical protein